MKFISVASLLLMFLYSFLAFSQKPPIAEEWKFGVGMMTIFNPLYEGDDINGMSLVPDVRAKYADKFFASFGEGVGWKFSPTSKWQLGPLMRYKFRRNEKNEPSPFQVSGKTHDLEGLGDVGDSAELGGFFTYKIFPFLDTRFELRQGFGGHNGYLADASASLGQRWAPLIQKFTLTVRYASKEFMSTYFGVDDQQSARSGLSTYSPDGGLRSIGITSVTIYPAHYPWTVVGIASANMLQHEIAQSSLVQTRGRPQQYFLGLSLSYELQ